MKASLFQRYWEIDVVGGPEKLDFKLKSNEDSKNIRVQFEVTATIDIRYYNATIKIYNLGESKRKQLLFNVLQPKEIKNGPRISIIAGYKPKGSNGTIFNGVIYRAYTKREIMTGDFVTVLECSAPFLEAEKINVQSAVKLTKENLQSNLEAIIEVVRTSNGTYQNKIDKKAFKTNIKAVVDNYNRYGQAISGSLKFNAPAIEILKELEQKFNCKFFYDSEGFNVVPLRYDTDKQSKTPPTNPVDTFKAELEISGETGMIGSPIYTDTGAKFNTMLRPDLKVFQLIDLTSRILTREGTTRTLTTTDLIFRGDTHGDEWLCEVDANDVNQLIQNTGR